MNVKDEMKREWIDISSEEYRTYHFSGDSITIKKPHRLNVSNSGGHRILSEEGKSFYIPSGWICIEWIADPHFVA